MQTRSFYQVFRGFLTLIVVATVGLTFQTIYTFVVWDSAVSSILILAFTAVFLFSFYKGLLERDFRDWNRVELNGQTVTARNLFGKDLCTVDLSPGHPVYWARVWIPKERNMAEPILVLSNSPFSLPESAEHLFRTLFDRTKEVLIVSAPEHPAEWFPGAELVEVEQANGENIML